MPEDQRTFEANAHLHPGFRLETRQAKGMKLPVEPAQDNVLGEISAGTSATISQELILRLIRLLKES